MLNSPFEPPGHRWALGDTGTAPTVLPGRRPSTNTLINQIRDRVTPWRQAGYLGVTNVTLRLLRYWNGAARERPLFFCQVEALETVIYLTEVAHRFGDEWIGDQLRDTNHAHNQGLNRLAFRLTAGGRKRVVMAMIIAWHTLNKQAYPQDPRFGDAFLLVAPGTANQGRLRVLLPSDPENYYWRWDIVPREWRPRMHRADVVIANSDAFQCRERAEAPDQMVRRVCRDLGGKRHIIVINDQAHHSYRSNPGGPGPAPESGEGKEAENREEGAHAWTSGLEAVSQTLGLNVVYDLSDRPVYVEGSGYPEGTLFPWVVSDFSSIDAIESGLAKVPRVPAKTSEDRLQQGGEP